MIRLVGVLLSVVVVCAVVFIWSFAGIPAHLADWTACIALNAMLLVMLIGALRLALIKDDEW